LNAIRGSVAYILTGKQARCVTGQLRWRVLVDDGNIDQEEDAPNPPRTKKVLSQVLVWTIRQHKVAVNAEKRIIATLARGTLGV
jgi:hypothetical protein